MTLPLITRLRHKIPAQLEKEAATFVRRGLSLLAPVLKAVVLEEASSYSSQSSVFLETLTPYNISGH